MANEARMTVRLDLATRRKVERLAALRKEFCFKNSITSKWEWKKEVLFLFRCCNDDTLYVLNLRRVVAHWKELEDAPAEMLKADHGEGLKDCKGKLVPTSLMERIGLDRGRLRRALLVRYVT